MTNDDGLVELAGYCARTCLVLKDVTQGRDADGLSGPSKEAVEDLGRYVEPVLHSVDDEEQYQDHAQHRVCSRRTPEQCLQFAGASPRFHRGVSHYMEDGASDDTNHSRRT